MSWQTLYLRADRWLWHLCQGYDIEPLDGHHDRYVIAWRKHD